MEQGSEAMTTPPQQQNNGSHGRISKDIMFAATREFEKAFLSWGWPVAGLAAVALLVDSIFFHEHWVSCFALFVLAALLNWLLRIVRKRPVKLSITHISFGQ